MGMNMTSPLKTIKLPLESVLVLWVISRNGTWSWRYETQEFAPSEVLGSELS